MTVSRHRRRHKYQRPRSAWMTRLALGAGGLAVLGGAAVVLALVWGRPAVSLTSSSLAMFDVKVKGFGTRLTSGQATSQGRPLVLIHEAGGLVPANSLAQGQQVEVTATAAPPGWLHWLLGGRVSTTRTFTTPVATPAAPVALASAAGSVPVRFDRPVSVVEYRTPGAGPRVVRLAHPASVAELAVPADHAGGSLEVTAAPRPWETVAPQVTTVTWFEPPPGGGTPALVQPAPGTATAAPNAPITLTFAQPVAAIFGHTRPTLSPAVPGSWSAPAPNSLVFTPSGFGFGPATTVIVGFNRPVAVAGAGTANRFAVAASTYQFSTGAGSLLRMEQILAQLNYLPLQFVPGPGVTLPTTFTGEVASMSRPLAGSFVWRWASTPASLQAQWTTGTSNLILKGALMAFLSNQSSNGQPSYDGYQVDPETVSQLADASTWTALLQAAAGHQLDPNPYSYVYVSQNLPETMTLWQNGSVVLTSAANTGIPQAPTESGTFPIYVRYTFNYMSGFNPDGSYYHDPVYWINYFNGGDAVHGFVRGSYGFPQSLGCVELPIPTAAVAFSDLAVGDLVTVA